jgi:hypothetical protein
MMLQKTERFQADVKRYSEAIERMADGQAKLEAKKLLNDLVYEVRNMDNMYLDMVYSKQLPSLGNDIKSKITSIRKSLDNYIKNIPRAD